MKTTVLALSMFVLTLADSSRGQGFTEAFDGDALPLTWKWIREKTGEWRIRDGALELRAQKARVWGGNGAANLLMLDLPSDGASAEVTVEQDAPKNIYEQGGLLLYRDDANFVKLIVEYIESEGGYFIVMAREIEDQGKVVTKIATGAKKARLRLAVEGETVTASFRLPEDKEWKPAGNGELPKAAQGKFTLFTQDGSDEEERWICFDDFQYTGAPSAATGAQSLFDGQSLAGWKGGAPWWRVEEGAIVGEIPAGQQLGTNEFLFWDGEVHDFELRLQFRISGDPSANSGVMFRCQPTPEGGAAGYQADIDDGAVWAGRIYDEHGRALIAERGMTVLIHPTGQRYEVPFRAADNYKELVRKDDWNLYVIRAVGPHLRTWLNGELTADLTDNEIGVHDFSGRLAIQLHAGPGPAKIAVKDIVLTPLGSTPLPKQSLVKPAEPRGGTAPEGLNLGFEKGTLEGWTAAGDAWKDMPVEGDTVTPRRPGQASQHAGRFWVGGYERTRSDSAQGTLTSEPFEVTHPWASFLVGGGPNPETRVEIVEAGTGAVLFSAIGKELENMEPASVDLSAHLGKKIRVRVVDESSGFWGHVNYDDFRFHDEKPGGSKPARVATNPILRHLVPNPADEGAPETVADMWVPEGFKVDLIMKEPEVTQPIAFTFDARGRLWVAEAHSYPHRQPEGEGKDRIVIFEDADTDGKFEKKTVFATGLNLVSGLEVGFGGVWVGAAPQLLFIPDKNRDDVPDGEPEVLLDGWGYQDTHETLNSFTWGPDGWLYGNQGVFNRTLVGKPGTPDDQRIEMHAGVWRYHPQRHVFEVFAHGGSNQWGIDFNEVGDLFITHCRSAWGGGPTSYMIRNGHYWNQSNSSHAPFVSAGQAGWNPTGQPEFRNFLPSSAHYGHGEGGAGAPGSRAIYGGHSHVGTMIYLGGNWPEEYRDQLFTLNLHGHQMNRQINKPDGSGYETLHSGADQLFVPDERFVGVDLKYGPDGAVYMIDWYDKQHCHTNNDEAWDRSDGRIYRMEWAATYKPVKVDLEAMETKELVALVTSKDEWYSRTARRLLQERMAASANPNPADLQVTKLEAHPERELASAFLEAKKTGDVGAQLRALWACYATDGNSWYSEYQHPFDGEFRLWDDPSPVIRACLVNLWAEGLEREKYDDVLVPRFLTLGKTDPSPKVRLALASALPDLEDNDHWLVAEALAAHAEDKDDVFLPKMIWYGLASIALSDPERALHLAETTPMPVLSDSIVWYLSREPAGRMEIAKVLADASPARAARILELMVFALPPSQRLPAPDGWDALAAKLRTPATAANLDSLGALFGDITILSNLRRTVIDKTAPPEKRREAFDYLKATGDTECADQFVALLDEPAYRVDVLPLLARFNDPKVAAALLSRLPQLAGTERNATLAALTAKPVLALALLKAIQSGTAEKSMLTSLHIRQMSNLHDSAIDALLPEVWGPIHESTAEAKDAIAKYKKLYHEAPLWSFDGGAGRPVFEKVCATCHQLNGKGVALGPALTGSYANGVDYFIENIVDPNAVIGAAFQLSIVTKNDGTVLSGMPANETDAILTLRTVTESLDIPKSEIKTRQILEQSMMPPGLLETLTEKEVIELLMFLSSKND